LTNQKGHITVFEHEQLRLGHPMPHGEKLSDAHLQKLEEFYGDGKNFPYYSLINKGVKFCEYVGVIQVGKLVIEVLPKADKQLEKTVDDQKSVWRDRLIGMLKAIGSFNIHAPSSTSLRLKSNSVLDLYFELFVAEVEVLLHRGLVKRYRKTEGNTTALKGSLQFGKHIQQNLVHKERFYVRHTVYDREHPFNCVLYKALRLLLHINTNAVLQSRIGSLLLNFPEMPDIAANEAFFNKLQYNRKTEAYRSAMEIARLILLNYHPDVKNGQNHVLALMFDMNLLWEKFVYMSLRKYCRPGVKVLAKETKNFWRFEEGRTRSMWLEPDIYIEWNGGKVVLDTKWKNLDNIKPDIHDLRQMYAYTKYFNAQKVALVYPGENVERKGNFNIEGSEPFEEGNECSLIPIKEEPDIVTWQKNIWRKIENTCLKQKKRSNIV
jgi:5-methylcytosine-specific restriction enzyme subunit McrC